jgi:hypothetical protein
MTFISPCRVSALDWTATGDERAGRLYGGTFRLDVSRHDSHIRGEVAIFRRAGRLRRNLERLQTVNDPIRIVG